MPEARENIRSRAMGPSGVTPRAAGAVGVFAGGRDASAEIEPRSIVTDTIDRRNEAQKLLRALLDAKAVSERNMRELNQHDHLKRVTGRTSMDNAIASTQRLIESFNRVLNDLDRHLDGEDLDLLREIERKG